MSEQLPAPIPESPSPPLPSSPSPEDPTTKRRVDRQRRIKKILRLLGIPGGIGLAPTIYLLKTGQFPLALLTGVASLGVVALALAAKFFSELLDKVLDRIETRLEDRIDPLADWIVTRLEGGILGLWWQITPQFRGAYYRHLVFAHRTYQTQGLKTPGAHSPDLEKVFVPLRVTSQSWEQISPDLIQTQEAKGSLTIWDFLAESRRQDAYKRLVIIGAPGSGKTTLLRHLTLLYARNAHRQQNHRTPSLIPVLLLLHKIRDEISRDQPPELAPLIVAQIRSQPTGRNLNLSPLWFADKLHRGHCLVMLDGLDEVADDQQRQAVSRWVDQQLQTYPETTWILTSRPFGYANAQLQEARTTLAVQPFSLEQMQQFLQRWYLQNEILRQARKPDPGVTAAAETKAQDLISRIQQSPPLAAMALNPLLLTMIATVHDNRGALPGNRVDLYAEICEVLLVRRQEVKGLEKDLETMFPLKANQKQTVLQVLALTLMVQATRDFTLKQVETPLREALQNLTHTALSPQQFLDHIVKITGLLQEREAGLYQFAHLSFQEYLASLQVKEPRCVVSLVNHLDSPWWHETIRLYAAKSDVTPLVEAALTNPSTAALMIAYDCADEGKSLAPAVRQRLENISLDSNDPTLVTLLAEVRLARRLGRLVRLDEATYIDQQYLSQAEFQFFRSSQAPAVPCDPTQDPTQDAAPSPQRPITHLTLEQALAFCNWLTDWQRNHPLFQLGVQLGVQSVVQPESQASPLYFYRLPTSTEAQGVPAPDHPHLQPQTPCTWSTANAGLRLVRATIPSDYYPLYGALVAGDVDQADQATSQLVRKWAGNPQQTALDAAAIRALPGGNLLLLDQLWLQYSQGRCGFTVQAALWQGIARGNPQQNPQQTHQQFAAAVGWHNHPVSRPAGQPLPWGHFPRSCYADLSAVAAMITKVNTCGLDVGMLLTRFEVVTVDEHGEEQTRTPGQARFLVEDLGRGVTLDMVAIPGGRFLMGTADSEKATIIKERLKNGTSQENAETWTSWETPQHRVTVPAFFMGKTPITQAQYQAIMGKNPSHFKGANRPVEKVSWNDAMEFCQKLSQKTGKDYRLPSEAEWEYACRASPIQSEGEPGSGEVRSAGTTTPFHFGATITPDLVNYDGNYPYGNAAKGTYRKQTTEVGSFPPNAFGLYDLHGTVWEWCADNWHDNYNQAPTDGSIWKTSDFNNDLHVLRGGSWNYNAVDCRAAGRGRRNPDFRFSHLGFRVVCVPGART